ncbi:KilA-N domain-containing protein [uncultured Propionivibrio sp.]|uniref:KilA-N domain-containing protein n=1 Tax=uncultured Propionivibrio sp. TaxID=426737 RepID=UPI0029C07BDF|nr:KilA-N domain-containing protein [uncultured Propionivibrio sp.]
MAFTFREDGYFNMTKAAAHFGKQLQHFWQNMDTWQYVESLAKLEGKISGIPMSLLPQDRCQAVLDLYIETKRGRSGGTWAHPKLAIRFARWLDTDFEVWCDSIIEDILRGNAELTITKPEVSATVQASAAPVFSKWPLSWPR